MKTVNRRIKVLQLLEWFERGGGLEAIVGEIACGLNKQKYDVEIWSITRTGTLVDEYKAKGIPVRVLNISTYHNPFNFLKLAWLLKEARVDIIHTHTYFTATIGRVAGWMAGVRTMVHHVHSTYWRYSFVNVCVERVLSRWTSKIICVSQAVKKFVVDDERINEAKTIVIPNGIAKKNLSIDKETFRNSLGIKKDDCVIICVASLFKNKGHGVLLEAVERLAGDHQNLKVLIVGEGDREDALKKQTAFLKIEEKVFFLGVRGDVPELLFISDIFVLCSLEREGMPVSILEAMAYGLPVVASAVGGIPEIVKDRSNGCLVSVNNPLQLAQCLDELIRNSHMRKSLGLAGQELYERRFTRETMLSAIEYVYEECLT
jgi:glycosyltransferase involved in cell wall biosynthesis